MKNKNETTKTSTSLNQNGGRVEALVRCIEQFNEIFYGNSPISFIEITIPSTIHTDEVKLKIEIDAFCNVKIKNLSEPESFPGNAVKIFTCDYKIPLALAIASMLPHSTRKFLKSGNVLSEWAEYLVKAGVNIGNNFSEKTNKADLPENISSTTFNGLSETSGVNKQTSSLREPIDDIKLQKSNSDEE